MYPVFICTQWVPVYFSFHIHSHLIMAKAGGSIAVARQATRGTVGVAFLRAIRVGGFFNPLSTRRGQSFVSLLFTAVMPTPRPYPQLPRFDFWLALMCPHSLVSLVLSMISPFHYVVSFLVSFSIRHHPQKP